MLVQRAFENPSKGQEIILLYCSLCSTSKRWLLLGHVSRWKKSTIWPFSPPSSFTIKCVQKTGFLQWNEMLLPQVLWLTWLTVGFNLPETGIAPLIALQGPPQIQ